MPNRSLLKQCRPDGVMKVVRRRDSSERGICQNPLLASSFVKTLAPASWVSVLSTLGSGWTSLRHYYHPGTPCSSRFTDFGDHTHCLHFVQFFSDLGTKWQWDVSRGEQRVWFCVRWVLSHPLLQAYLTPGRLFGNFSRKWSEDVAISPLETSSVRQQGWGLLWLVILVDCSSALSPQTPVVLITSPCGKCEVYTGQEPVGDVLMAQTAAHWTCWVVVSPAAAKILVK